MVYAYIAPRFRLTIPKQIRETTNLHVGDKVAFLRKGDEVVFVKVPDDPLTAMAGSLSTGKDVRAELARMKDEDLEAEGERGL